MKCMLYTVNQSGHIRRCTGCCFGRPFRRHSNNPNSPSVCNYFLLIMYIFKPIWHTKLNTGFDFDVEHDHWERSFGPIINVCSEIVQRNHSIWSFSGTISWPDRQLWKFSNILNTIIWHDRLVPLSISIRSDVNYKCFLIVIFTKVYVNFWIGNSNSIAAFCHFYAILMLYDVSSIITQKSGTGQPHFLI